MGQVGEEAREEVRDKHARNARMMASLTAMQHGRISPEAAAGMVGWVGEVRGEQRRAPGGMSGMQKRRMTALARRAGLEADDRGTNVGRARGRHPLCW